MRHGEPKPGAQMDAGRGLTQAGKQQAEEMAAFMQRQVGRVDIVITSPFARCAETADIMAPAVGAHVASTTLLEPNRKPKDAWAEIERLAQQSEDVLVVGHHPEIAHLIDHIAGVHGIGHDFRHGSIAAVDTAKPALLWLVTPQLVEREIEIDAEEAALLADALEMADAGLELAEAVTEERPSLRHPKHAKLIRPIVRKVRKLVGSYFAAQGQAIELIVRPWLKLHMSEADDPSKQKALDILPDTVVPLAYPVTNAEEVSYQALINDAIRKAEAQMESEFDTGAAIPETEVSAYLRDNSLAKLTGDLAAETKTQLRNAIANAVQEGGTADDIVEAIQETVDKFSSVRAGMIAQTEVNDAYNAGRSMLATSAGLDQKAWITESGNPCPECIGNELEGWVPIDAVFSSGDEMPTAHPMCCLPGTPVTAFGVSRAVRRRYKGEICVFSFAGLPDLAVTPNHPVLTRCGLIAAKAVQIEDGVLQCSRPADSTAFRLPHPDHDYVETDIEEIFDSFALANGGAACGVPVSAEAFHGDASVDDEVDIVYPAGKLSLNGPEGPENFQYFSFADTRGLPSELLRESNLRSLFDACDSSPGGSVGGLGTGLSLIDRESRISKQLSSASIALLEAEPIPVIGYSAPTDTDAERHCEDGFASQVRVVKVMKIERRQFDGHVYNLETESGYYTAQSILVHNCYCGLDYRKVS